MGESYLVIGGEGFLGSTLVKALLNRYPTASVSSLDLVQRHFPDELSSGRKWTFYSADLTSLDSLSTAIRQSGATTVFHTASPWTGSGAEVCEKVNVQGTQTVVDACVQERVQKFVFTSSAGTVYNGVDLINVDERMPFPKEELDPYNVTKAKAERIVLEANGKNGLLTVALRPAGIFGPGRFSELSACQQDPRRPEKRATQGGEAVSQVCQILICKRIIPRTEDQARTKPALVKFKRLPSTFCPDHSPSDSSLVARKSPSPTKTVAVVYAEVASTGMFRYQHHLITRRAEISFLLDLREADEAPRRSDRGQNERRLPEPLLFEEGPFSFKLSHIERSSEWIQVRLLVTRNSATGDESIDCEQKITDIKYFRKGNNSRPISLNHPDSPSRDTPAFLPRGGDEELLLTVDHQWSLLSSLFGEEEAETVEMNLSFTMEAHFGEPTGSTTQSSNISALDSLGELVSAPWPNNVAFILSSCPSHPLFSNKSLLSSVSPYFKRYFDPSPLPQRSAAKTRLPPSFVDDSDLESDDDDDDDLEDLVSPENLGQGRSKRGKSAESETEASSERGEQGEEDGRAEESGDGEMGRAKRKKTAEDHASSEADVEENNEDTMTEIHVDDGSYATMQAILVFLICGKIEFAPLSSQGRDAYIKEYRKKYPHRLLPVSPRSVYRLASRFEFTALQDLALAQLKYLMTLETAVSEALNEDCYHFPKYCSLVHDRIVKDWTVVRTLPVWRKLLKAAEKGHYTHSSVLLPRLLLRV